MSVKILDVNEFLKLLIEKTTPEYAKEQQIWFMRVCEKITAYGVQLATDAGLGMCASEESASAKLYKDICDELLYKLPARAVDRQKITDMEELLNPLSIAVLHFMTKYPVEGDSLIIGHADTELAKQFTGVSVATCEEHGIHVDAIRGSVPPKSLHVH
jgi:hypothetical protein